MHPDLLVILGVAGILICIFLFATLARGIESFYERKRTRAWQEVATRPGMEFLGERNDALRRYGHMRLFQVGRSRKMYNVVSVSSGDVRVIIGDFLYRTEHHESNGSTSTRKRTVTHRRTVCVLENNAMNVPHCYLRPERKLFDTLGGMLGGQDIDFAGDPEFSSAYVLQGDEERPVRELFDAEVRVCFAERKNRRFHFEAQGNVLALHTGKQLPPQRTPELVPQALGIMKLLARNR